MEDGLENKIIIIIFMKKFFVLLFTAVLLFSIQQSVTAQGKRNVPLKVELTAVAAKPIIGVSSTAESGMAAAPLTYINSIKRAGGVPIVIPMTADEDQLNAILNVVDGIVMTGGEDLDPLYFGEEPNLNLGEVAPQRDAFDCKLIKMAVAKGIPVLGVCRGEQIMNVAFGGTLYQDLPSQKKDIFVQHNQNSPSGHGSHSITIEKGSMLNAQLGVETITVNSYHHQAVKDVAPGFKVTAYSKDGVVEAIEKIGSDKVWGVQFHPEGFVSLGDDRFIGVFKHLINKALENRI